MSCHVLYTHDSQSRFSKEPVRAGVTVEVFWHGEWIGGYFVHRRYSTFVAVTDKTEGFFSEVFDVPLTHVRLAENPEPI